MFKTLKEVYDSKIFHGVKTEAEAYELCKEESENHGKEHVLIWFLKEKDGKLSEKVIGYCRDSEDSYRTSVWLATTYFKGFQSRSLKKFPCGYISDIRTPLSTLRYCKNNITPLCLTSVRRMCIVWQLLVPSFGLCCSSTQCAVCAMRHFLMCHGKIVC